ncbi:MAG: ribosomal protein L20 [Planctomycetota bacterium]|jgi:ribosomal protein L20
MKWVIAGLLFALAVGLAVGTAGIRADNVVVRRDVEKQYRAINDRKKEFQRLWFQRLKSVSPERLAEMHNEWLQKEGQRRQERVQ